MPREPANCGRDEGDIVREGSRHAAISKALDNRNAAGPCGLKSAASKALDNRNAAGPCGLKCAASFQGLSLIARPFYRRPCRRQTRALPICLQGIS